jgi:hypothetical protein
MNAKHPSGPPMTLGKAEPARDLAQQCLPAHVDDRRVELSGRRKFHHSSAVRYVASAARKRVDVRPNWKRQAAAKSFIGSNFPAKKRLRVKPEVWVAIYAAIVRRVSRPSKRAGGRAGA